MYRKNLSALKQLIHCADITRKYCNRYCGILVVDGKYLAVRNYDRKIPVLYGIDYLSHDIPKYKPFMAEINQLFKKKLSYGVFVNQAKSIYEKYKADPKCKSVMLDMRDKLPLLLAHLQTKHIPRTTNLIECFNSHLQGRLKTIKGFKSFKHADLWLNAYFIRRRFKKFKDCKGQFKCLNGRRSIDIVVNTELVGLGIVSLLAIEKDRESLNPLVKKTHDLVGML